MRTNRQISGLKQLNEGNAQKLPASVIRSVSFQKLKQGIPISQSQRQSIVTHPIIYQKAINQKLYSKDKQNNKQIIESRNRIKSKKQQLSHKEKEQLKQCTFQPKINNKNSSKRTLQEFIQHQIMFQQNKEDKLNLMREMLRENAEKQNTFHPNLIINIPFQRQQRQPVYERLYQYSKEKQQKLNQAVQAQIQKSIQDANRPRTLVSRASSKASLKDPRNSEDTICLSGRRSKGVSLTKKKTQVENENNLKKKNEQKCINKIFRQIANILAQLDIKESKLSYLQMSEILYEIKFINNKSNDEQNTLDERKYLYQIWQMLQGDIQGHISLISLLKVIYAIMGCHDTALVAQLLQNRIQTDNQLHLQQFIITEKDSKSIKANFQSFYANRLKEGTQKSIDPNYQNYSFKPTISKLSSQMAEKYRMRVIGQSEKLIDQNLINFQVPEDGQITHIDLLMLDQKRKQLKIKKQREEAEALKKMEQDQIMGLRNKHLNQYSIPHTSRDSRFHDLYQHGRSNQRKDKSKDEVEAEKWSQQLTFKPQITGPSYLRHQHLSNSVIPDFHKAIFRMYEGRRIKEIGNNQKNAQCSHNKVEQQVVLDKNPILYLNVCMEGNENIRVAVFKDDNLKTISSKVKKMLNIDERTNNKQLEQLLRMQIEPSLESILKDKN